MFGVWEYKTKTSRRKKEKKSKTLSFSEGKERKITDTHSKSIASATRPTVSTRDDQHWFKTMDKKKKKKKKRNAMKPPSYAPSKILLVVVQNLYDFASLASVCYTGLWVPRVLCVSAVVPPVIFLSISAGSAGHCLRRSHC
jgi:hypothetical protein